MSRRAVASRLLPMGIPVALLGVGPTRECDYQTQATLYQLSPERSSFTRRCFPPRVCPLRPPPLPSRLSGSFVLLPLPAESTAQFTVFALKHVDWRTEGGAFDGLPIRGEGRYRLASYPPGDKLELDLVVGDGPVQHFDRGTVVFPPAGAFPEIEIDVSMLGHSYDDTLLIVSAAPLFASLTTAHSSFAVVRLPALRPRADHRSPR